MKFDFDIEFLKMMNENDLNTIYILGHMNPDGDACGCVMGLAHYIHKNYPYYKVLPYLSEKLDKGPKKQVLDDEIFDPFEIMKADRYGVIVCDTATKERIIGRDIFEKAVASIVIDHHASNEGYGDVNNTVISESCSENIYHMLNKDLLVKAATEEHPNVADYLYLGIIHDTSCFHRANAKLLNAASNLLSIGADHDYVMRTFFSQTLEEKEKEAMLYSMVQKEFDGKVAFILVDDKIKKEKGITYEDIHPISGNLRDCEDIKLGFTMYEEEPNIWRCSFRSDKTWINVNELLKPFGGGGHAAASGLRKETDDIQCLVDSIFHKIMDSIQNDKEE